MAATSTRLPDINQGGIISAEMRGEIKKCIRDIYEMKYEVMKMAGDFRGSD